MDPTVAYARTSDDVSIAYLAQGSGPAFVMMPGVPFSNVVAEWQIPVLRRAYLDLADRMRIVQYDGRGSGHSQRVIEDLSLDAMLLDVAAVVDGSRCSASTTRHSTRSPTRPGTPSACRGSSCSAARCVAGSR